MATSIQQKISKKRLTATQTLRKAGLISNHSPHYHKSRCEIKREATEARQNACASGSESVRVGDRDLQGHCQGRAQPKVTRNMEKEETGEIKSDEREEKSSHAG
ncbi:hypothetical protein AVEN_149506-1 [Araneus ventricosus]|uniref:Uncharacterized protein n=1 Tax=Araneus ventricosus TaxID=182803 RepID=A0A4Y2QHH7_ARAVE|nr:hypothetical protein AVEN_149506-1 [Araneus ventricosus]